MTLPRHGKRPLSFLFTAIFALSVAPLQGAQVAFASGAAFGTGDILADVGQGKIRHFTANGTLVDTLSTTAASHEGDGLCFDGAENLFATQGFIANTVSKFDTNGNLLAAHFGSGYTGHPESCVVDAAGHIFVGQPDGTRQLLEFNAAGTLLKSFSPVTQDRGTDWIDLAHDQCTMFYTSESTSVKRFNVCTNTQLADFATGLQAPCFAHRLRPNGEVMVACARVVYRLSSSGAVVQTYPLSSLNPSDTLLFALNLDADGTSFWTADYFRGDIFKINIATGAVLKSFTSAPLTVLGGLAVVKEITVAQDRTPPACTLSGVIAGPPKQLKITVQDTNSGLKSIVPTVVTNATVSIPAFTVGTTLPVVVTATKIDQSLAATVTVKATDVQANAATCDPELVTVSGHPGRPVSKVVTGIAQSENTVSIYNSTPGVKRIDVKVNGKTFFVTRLSDGEVRTIDVAAGLHAGNTNTIVLTPRDQAGSAEVLISDMGKDTAAQAHRPKHDVVDTEDQEGGEPDQAG